MKFCPTCGNMLVVSTTRGDDRTQERQQFSCATCPYVRRIEQHHFVVGVGESALCRT